MKNYLLVAFSAFLLACQTGDAENTEQERKNREITVSVKADETKTITAEEKAIQTIIIALYDKNGVYLAHQELSGNGSVVSCVFDDVEETSLPVSAVAVANTEDGKWSLDGLINWNLTDADVLNGLVIKQQINGAELIKGSTPLPMYGKNRTQADSRSVTLTLRRAVSIVTVFNQSAFTIDYIDFSLLNNSCSLKEGVVPSLGIYSHKNDGLSLLPNGSVKYYFMPTADGAEMEFRSGEEVRKNKLERLGSNDHRLIDITIDKYLSISITVSVPDEWEDDLQ